MVTWSSPQRDAGSADPGIWSQCNPSIGMRAGVVAPGRPIRRHDGSGRYWPVDGDDRAARLAAVVDEPTMVLPATAWEATRTQALVAVLRQLLPSSDQDVRRPWGTP